MVLASTQLTQPQSINSPTMRVLSDELVVFCPECKTLETLCFNNGFLMPTRKFNQQGKQVFHDCGTPEPCRLYRAC